MGSKPSSTKKEDIGDHLNLPFLIPKEEFAFHEKLGEGYFGIVTRATWQRSNGSKIPCAVKMIQKWEEKPVEAMGDIRGEISSMQKLKHKNIVSLHGVIFEQTIHAVIELCENGSLIDRIRAPNKPLLHVTKLLDYTKQIAEGMCYLESKNCIHRDLAARNVLLTSNEEIAKICDFGLTRYLAVDEKYYISQKSGGVLPVSWCAPECLKFFKFSHLSDVWAFGVTLWEMFTYGKNPWEGYKPREIIQLIEGGQRLEKPVASSDELYDIMLSCWALSTSRRPSFLALNQILENMDLSIVECIKSVNESGVKRGDKLIVISHSANMKTNLYRGQLMDSRRIITVDKCYFSSPPVTKKHPSFNLDRTKLQTMETSSDGYEQPNKNGSMRIPRPATDPPTVLRQTPHSSVRLIQPPASRAPPPVPPRSSSRIATTAPNYNIRI